MKYISLGELRLLQGARPTRGEWKTWVLDGATLLGTRETSYAERVIRGAPRTVPYEIPDHFMTDFASIPRVFRTLFDPAGAPWQRAAVLHDYLYAMSYESRLTCDRQYRDQALSDGANKVAVLLQYAALRVGGLLAYRNNRKNARRDRAWRILRET